MAWRFDESTFYLNRTSDVLNVNSPYTVMFWAYPISAPPTDAWSSWWVGALSGTVGDFLQWKQSTNQWELYIANGGFGGGVGSTVTTGAWIHVALVRAGTNDIKLYLNGVQDISVTDRDIATRGTITSNTFGASPGAAELVDGRVAIAKAWSTNLTVDEIKAEMRCYWPKKRTNLYGFWPALNGSDRYKDFSGNARDWSSNGTYSGDEPGAPIPWLPTQNIPGLAAAASISTLVHYVKQVTTDATVSSTTPVEETNYTIPWSDLSTAGFANNDEVIVLVTVKCRNSSANNNSYFQIGTGTTYAGRSDIAESLDRREVVTTGGSQGGSPQYIFLDKRTLVSNDNWYFSTWNTAGTSYFADFKFILLKVGGTNGLGSSDYAYAEATHSGASPTSYDTSGASISTPASGDWLLFAAGRVNVNSTAYDQYMAIQVDGTDYSEINWEGEDVDDQHCFGTLAYRASLGSSITCRVRYRCDTSSGHEQVRTAIFALRLNAFKDYVGVHSTNTITHSVIDTYQEFWAPTYSASNAGYVLAFGYPIHTYNESNKRAYGRIQLSNSDWPSSGANRTSLGDNGAAANVAPFLVGYASVSSGSLDFDMDVAEDQDVTPNYDCNEQIGAIFSLTLAPSGNQFQQSAAGTLTSAGAIIFQTRKVPGGTLSSSGALSRDITRPSLSGILSSAGNLFKRADRSLSGTLSSSGILNAIKLTLKILDGTLSSSGGLTKSTTHYLGGSLPSTGALTRQLFRSLTGVLSSGGSLIKSTSKAFDGVLSSAGNLAAVKAITKIIEGVLSSSGNLTRQINKVVSGNLSSTGNVSRIIAFVRSVSGTLISSGDVNRSISKNVAGMLTPIGSLSRQTKRFLAGILTSAGNLIASLTSSITNPGTVIIADIAPYSAIAGDAAYSLSTTAIDDNIVYTIEIGDDYAEPV